MKIFIPKNMNSNSRRSAFTLAEVMVGVSIMSIMFLTLYLGFTQGFSVVQGSRENLRATQILQQQAEVIRLYTWEQIDPAAGWIPPTQRQISTLVSKYGLHNYIYNPQGQ